MVTFKKTCVSLFLIGFGTTTQAAIISGLTIADFTTPVTEKFTNTFAITDSYNFGNGMTFSDLNSQIDLINYSGAYGVVDETFISSGLDGDGDGYFGTVVTPTSFQFSFASGITRFGFYGAESSVSDGSLGRNGELDISFYDLSNNLLGSLAASTSGTFAWDQFHGFMSDSGSIGRVVFSNVGHMVLDNVTFQSASSVPEPSTLMLFGIGITGLVFSKRRRQAA